MIAQTFGRCSSDKGSMAMAKTLCMVLLLLAACSTSPAPISGRTFLLSQETFQAWNEPDPDPTIVSQSSFAIVATTSVILRDEEQTFYSLAAENDAQSLIASIVMKPLVSLDSIASILQENGLPVGLLPDSVDSYVLSDDGTFSVSLSGDCYVDFDYEVYYAETITGTLSYGSISNLSGIKAKKFFIWLSVTGIRVDDSSSDYIYFDIGSISKKLSISQFETVPSCKATATSLSAIA